MCHRPPTGSHPFSLFVVLGHRSTLVPDEAFTTVVDPTVAVCLLPVPSFSFTLVVTVNLVSHRLSIDEH